LKTNFYLFTVNESDSFHAFFQSYDIFHSLYTEAGLVGGCTSNCTREKSELDFHKSGNVRAALSVSGKAMSALCPGAKNILLPPLRKTTKYEVKNRCKSSEEGKTEHLL